MCSSTPPAHALAHASGNDPGAWPQGLRHRRRGAVGQNREERAAVAAVSRCEPAGKAAMPAGAPTSRHAQPIIHTAVKHAAGTAS